MENFVITWLVRLCTSSEDTKIDFFFSFFGSISENYTESVCWLSSSRERRFTFTSAKKFFSLYMRFGLLV